MVQPPLDWQPSPNYTKGRQGTPVRKITFHHVVGTAASAVSKFKNPASATSAHFVVSPTKIYCCVDTDNTAWTNSVWASNLESVTIEHEGDWRFGYYNAGVIEQSAILVAWLRSLYPTATFNRHRDIKATACPGDLPVELIWNKATAILNPPKPPAPPVAPASTLNVVDIQNKIVTTKIDANLWDLNFKTWAEAKSTKVIPKGTDVEVSATARHPLGSTYYMTEYSYSKGIQNGINVADCTDKVVVVPPVTPPVVTPPPVEPPMVPPVVPPVVEPDRNAIIAFLTMLRDLITNFLGKFK
jgi:N-acetylmuramoyl-L-alanine amidase CwlA